MKKIEVTEEFYNAALKLAEYIGNSDSEAEDFEEHLAESYNPQEHIYYQASIVGGWDMEIEP